MKKAEKIFTVLILAAAVFFIIRILTLIFGMNGAEEFVRKLPAPSGNVVAIQTYQAGFADNSAYMYLKHGRFTRKQQLGSFSHILDAWWEPEPELLYVKHTHTFAINDNGVYIDSFDVAGTKIQSRLVGHYVTSPDGATSTIVTLEEKTEEAQ